MKFFTKEQRILFGLSVKEGALLDVLHKKGVCNTSELAYKASLPRVTVMRILSILKNRGFVMRKEQGREVLWSLNNVHTLRQQYNDALTESDTEDDKHIPLSEVGNLTVYRGIKGMIESNERMLVAHAGERVLAVEPNGIWKHVAEVQFTDIYNLNMAWKERRILIEMIAEEGFEKIINDHITRDIGKSFLELATDVRVVPRGMLDSATEILIFRDQVLFTDWAHLVGVEIKNPSTVRVLKAMFRLLQSVGRVYCAERK